MHEDGGKRAILLLAHGTPDALDEIPAYLSNITGGHPVPDAVVQEIRHRYSLIGRSPLTELTLEQARLLEKALGLPVYVGMRNWKPYIADTISRMRADGIASAVAICLAPHNSRTSVGLYRRAVFAASADSIAIDFVEGWGGHPLLARAFAERLTGVWREASKKAALNVPVVFTAHSVPCRTIFSEPAPLNGPPAPAPDTYSIEAKHTAANVAGLLEAAGLTDQDWFFAFQSQGASAGPWIGPTVEGTLAALRQQGNSAVVVQPIGFLCDHIEVLYDIDIGFRKFAAGIGLEITRPPSLNDSPLLIEALADLARQGLERLDRKTGAVTARSA